MSRAVVPVVDAYVEVPPMLKVTIIVGSPKAGSRTLRVAEVLGEKLLSLARTTFRSSTLPSKVQRSSRGPP